MEEEYPYNVYIFRKNHNRKKHNKKNHNKKKDNKEKEDNEMKEHNNTASKELRLKRRLFFKRR